MQPHHSVFHLFRWFAGSLLILCILGNGLSTWIGGRLPTQLISLTLTDASEQAGKLHLLDVRLGLIVKVSDQPVSCCTLWSPDGTRIAFTGVNGEVFIWDMRSGKIESLPLPDKMVAVDDWSIDGQSLLLTHQRGRSGYQEIYRAVVNGGGFQRLTSSNDPFKQINFVQWAAHDRYIVFVQGSSYITRLWEIYRIDADGQNLQQLSDGEGVSYAPRISPDGRHIVFMKGSVLDSDLFIMDVDGSAARQLAQTQTNERLPIWSPDGTQLLFQAYIDADFPRTLELMNADGTGLRRLADELAFNALPSWSPDGQQIVYEVQYPDGIELYVVAANGSQRRLLLKSNWKTRLNPSWQPGM